MFKGQKHAFLNFQESKEFVSEVRWEPYCGSKIDRTAFACTVTSVAYKRRTMTNFQIFLRMSVCYHKFFFSKWLKFWSRKKNKKYIKLCFLHKSLLLFSSLDVTFIQKGRSPWISKTVTCHSESPCSNSGHLKSLLPANYLRMQV